MRKILALALLLLPLAVQASEPNKHIGSSAYEASHILKVGVGTLYRLNVSYHTAAYRTIMIFDGIAVPSNGAVTPCDAANTTGCLLWCREGDTQSTAATESCSNIPFGNTGLPFTFGAVVVASVSTSGCASLTIDSANEWFDAQIDTH